MTERMLGAHAMLIPSMRKSGSGQRDRGTQVRAIGMRTRIASDADTMRSDGISFTGYNLVPGTFANVVPAPPAVG